MSTGKYSPTVSASYEADQDWWVKNGGGYDNGHTPDADADNDGYDSYGYHTQTGRDRAGWLEDDYLRAYHDDEDGLTGYEHYESIADIWRGIVIGRDPFPPK